MLAEIMVKRGATYLDSKYPDWYKTIDLQTLNIGLWSKCILGQLAKSHGLNLDLLRIDLGGETALWDNGFIATPHFMDDMTANGLRMMNELMTEIWTSEIKTRLEKDNAVTGTVCETGS